MSQSKYEIYEELGRGRFGVVFKVKDKVNSEILAAKFVRCRKSEEKQKCKDEISIMNMLESPKLLQLAAAYENPREIIMVMEYIGGGELFTGVQWWSPARCSAAPVEVCNFYVSCMIRDGLI